ncbi:ATP-grasp fold amidoligase family protein [uncultured Shewanella sp.]|uniref:ATP-grasp fold amidoligase family protein n=1 Tax=uncultured Shewanella sp. TaxID=173975 RepID=UPI002636B7BB|nr:ATP-grasp fold amidoligase family protein [uncultured Shewanella sp.]
MNLFVFFAKLLPLTIRLKAYYLLKHRSFLDLKHPKKYSEKLQVRKLNMLPEYSSLSDKYAVREFVERKLGNENLIPLLGVYNSVSDIDFDVLPNAFVAKTNFGSGEEHIQIVKDKATINRHEFVEKFEKALGSSYKGSILGETQYDAIPKKIIIEEFIDSDGVDIEDFKFHIFNGKDGFLQIDFDRFSDHRRNLYSLSFEQLPFDLLYKSGGYKLPELESLNKLKQAALVLAEGFDYVRVDLYLVKGQVLFGEMTFTPGNGFESFSSIDADVLFGDMWVQPKIIL